MSNRLTNENSSYPQQHENEPIKWWPCCDEAFLKAEQENKAIFISIGYSSCHLCHDMQEKIFENKECIDILNKNFISIKVDKEERPDVDKYYQEVYMLLNRHTGGWPMNIFCTPQNKPFLARTYIVPESNAKTIEEMGFLELTRLIADKINKKDTKLFENAEEITGFINQIKHPKEATVLKESFYKNFMIQAKRNYDTTYGGFSNKPKFPHASTLRALLIINRLYNDKSAKNMLTNTLNNMIKGGMYDLVAGGFYRYGTDEKWLVPNFEKTLYDNALLCGLFTQAYMTYHDNRYLQVAKEVADFWYDQMSDDDLFYSLSDNKESSYDLYSYKEVYAILSENGYDNAQEMCAMMSVTDHGNLEGKNIIRFEKDIPTWFNEVRPLLQKIRQKKAYPFIDKKVQTSWSAMMINSLFELGAIDKTYKEKAVKSLDKLLEVMFINETLYHTTLIHKTPKIEAFLEDYAFLAQTLLTAFKYTRNEFYLINAQRTINKALERFYHKGMWHFSDGDFSVKAEAGDTTYTSSVSIMINNLITLGEILKDDKYTHFAFKTMEYNSYELGRKPIYYPSMLIQTLRYVTKDKSAKVDY